MMMNKTSSIHAAIRPAFAALVALSLLTSAGAAPAAKSAAFPLTTKSAEAHRFADEALVLYIDHVAQPEAIASLRKAIAADPNFAQAQSNLGISLLAQQKQEAARTALEAATATGMNPHCEGDARGSLVQRNHVLVWTRLPFKQSGLAVVVG